MANKMTPVDIFNLLSEREREQVRATLNIRQTPCERLGHKYKSVGRIIRWFLPPQNKLVCTQCGDTIRR